MLYHHLKKHRDQAEDYSHIWKPQQFGACFFWLDNHKENVQTFKKKYMGKSDQENN